jgi:hypothetical protein
MVAEAFEAEFAYDYSAELVEVIGSLTPPLGQSGCDLQKIVCKDSCEHTRNALAFWGAGLTAACAGISGPLAAFCAASAAYVITESFRECGTRCEIDRLSCN